PKTPRRRTAARDRGRPTPPRPVRTRGLGRDARGSPLPPAMAGSEPRGRPAGALETRALARGLGRDRLPRELGLDVLELRDRLGAPALERVAHRDPEHGLAEEDRVAVLVPHALEVDPRRLGELELEVE